MATNPITTGADQIRSIANGVPRWRTTAHNGAPVIVDDLRAVAELRDPWVPNLYRFFNAIHRDSLLKLAVLLEACAGSSAPKSIAGAAADLVAYFDVDDQPQPERTGLTFR